MRRTAPPPHIRNSSRRIGVATLVGCIALLSSSRAFAGPVEQMVELATAPGASATMVLRYINGGGGLFFSMDQGKTWSLQCNSSFLGQGGRVQGPVAILGDKTVLVLSSDGVLHADASGCGIAAETADVTKQVVDLALHPTDPMKVFAATSSSAMGAMNGVLERSASGQWTPIGGMDALSPLSLRAVMKEGALRFYEVAVKPSMMTGGASQYVLRVSDDQAKTWQEYPLATDTGRPRLRAVDPTNPDRLLIAVDRATEADTVLVSKDGGKTTLKYLDVAEFGGVAFAPDGRVWIGDLGTTGGSSPTRGLYAAANLDAMPARLPIATYAVQCLGWAADTNTLYACQRFWFGNVNLASGEFTSMVRFTDVPKFVSCPGEDTAAECKAQLCLDYCGPAHFAAAPVCSAYDEPSCGKPVALMESAESDPPAAAGSAAAGGLAGAGVAGSNAAAGSGATSGLAGSAAAGTGASAATGAAPAKGDSGGCSAGTEPHTNDRFAWLALGALAAIALWRRRSTPLTCRLARGFSPRLRGRRLLGFNRIGAGLGLLDLRQCDRARARGGRLHYRSEKIER